MTRAVKAGVVKLDIEGSELLALEGMTRILEEGLRVSLIIEINQAALLKNDASPALISKKLRELGYTHFQIIEKDISLPLETSLPETRATYNILVTRDEVPS